MMNLRKIPPNIMEDLAEWGLTAEEIAAADVFTLLNEWLEYQGIDDYTADIIEVYEALKKAVKRPRKQKVEVTDEVSTG